MAGVSAPLETCVRTEAPGLPSETLGSDWFGGPLLPGVTINSLLIPLSQCGLPGTHPKADQFPTELATSRPIPN
jgi:hypothetical protein